MIKLSKRKYEFKRFEGVYVSSSFNPFLNIILRENDILKTVTLDDDGRIENFGTYTPSKLPKYILKEIKEELKKYIEADKIFYYEYNQQEEKRFKNLKYAEPTEMNEQFLKWATVI